MSQIFLVALIAALQILESLTGSPATNVADVISVGPGGDLQAALNRVTPGGTVRLASGVTYVGNFRLPAKHGSSYVLITTGDGMLPPAGTRISVSDKSRLATIKSGNSAPALATDSGATYYRIVGVAFEANANGAGDIIRLGDHDQRDFAEVPHHLELDRVIITGHPTAGQKRGIAANAAHVLIANSDIRDIKAVGQDSQAIAGWNTPGPITIRNNYLEAAGENIMFGGAHINLPGAVPSDIAVEDNVLTKNRAWRGSMWTVKNLFELKNARRVLVRRNTLEYNWRGGQPGYAVVLTPRNSSGRTPWAVIEDVEFSGNVVRHSGSAFNLLGHDDTAPSGQLARVMIRNNLLYDINHSTWGGAGIFVQIGGEPARITIDHNTVLHTGNIVTLYAGHYPTASGQKVTAGPVTGFVFTNNLLRHNAYGIFGSGQGWGQGALNAYAPGAVVRRNVMASDRGGDRYPSDNFFPPLAEFSAGFEDMNAAKYWLGTRSHYVGAGTDGRDVGCDFTKLPAEFRP